MPMLEKTGYPVKTHSSVLPQLGKEELNNKLCFNNVNVLDLFKKGIFRKT